MNSTHACDAAFLTRHFNLQPHPEGGRYARTYCSPGVIPTHALPAPFAADRPYSTAILYLLEENELSRLHRLRQDEIWHFYLGGPLRLVTISPSGEFFEQLLGNNPAAGQAVQAVVPAGYWFGARPLPSAGFSFVGCTVAPGFDFADFELGASEDLRAKFPHLAACIAEFT